MDSVRKLPKTQMFKTLSWLVNMKIFALIKSLSTAENYCSRAQTAYTGAQHHLVDVLQASFTVQPERVKLTSNAKLTFPKFAQMMSFQIWVF